ncbi:MAG: class A beta-lactamase-related serine hydrolase [Defluviitaleaceae bacterium]|nr:class A beta-lactamase-related serine hydrolase [Defluviitaleaceae bacterium]
MRRGKFKKALSPSRFSKAFAIFAAIFFVIFVLSALPVAAQERHPPVRMSLQFYVYAEADFRAERTGLFNPQTVSPLYIDGDWALIRTYSGEGWIYTNGDRLFVERRLPVFDYKGSEIPIEYVSPQVVKIRDRAGNWVLVETWLGQKWMYLNYSPSTQHLDEMLRRFGNNISVYYRNIETGFTYTYNPGRVYFSASVPKASFSLYLYLRAERGEIDLDSYATYLSGDFNGGSGVIKNRYRFGTQLTQRELLRLNLSYSDNIATNILRRTHGIEGYRNFVASIGGNPNHVRGNIFNSNLTVTDAGLFAREIFIYTESGGAFSEEFRAHLLNNQFPFIVSDYPVASKTGWTRPHAWHDMAIIYADSPYILVILSARNGWTARDYRDFAEISMAFQEFNAHWFSN